MTTATATVPLLSPSPVLTDFFEPIVREHAHRPALRWRQGYRHYGLTFGELGAAVQAAARRLADSGVRPGDRVLLLGPSEPAWVVGFLGTLLAGGVVVPLDEGTRPEFASEVARRTDARLQVVSAGFAEATGIPALSLEAFHPTRREQLGQFEAPPREPDDLLEIVYTSGTTSRPKGVMLTHQNVIANVTSLRTAMAWPEGSRFLSVLPLSHMLGQVVGLFVPLRFGGMVFFPGTRRPSVLRDCFRREQITVLVTVPAFLDRIRQRVLHVATEEGRGARLERALGLARHLPDGLRRGLFRYIRREAFPDLKYVFVGGAALRAESEDFFNALGIRVLQGYGMTEAAPVITCNTAARCRPGTVGLALPGIQVRASSDGEIQVRGPNVTPGYLDDAEATGELLRDGWLHSGDLGALDAEGYWRILGRKKDVLIGPSGMNIYPEDVEAVLNRLPGVKESCVVGLEQGEGMRLVGYVLMSGMTPCDLSSLLAQANEELASHQRLQAIELWPEADFPRTRTMKVRRKDVLERVQRLDVSPSPSETGAGEADRLRALLRECLDLPAEQAIGEDQRLTKDLGLDSLGRIDVLSRIEEHFGVELPESAIGDETTVADLRRQFTEKPAAAARPSFPRWARRPAWSALRRLLGLTWRPLFRFYDRLEVGGREHLAPLAGPAIFIANHTSNLDTPAILAAMPTERRRRMAVAAAADYWFRGDRGFFGALPGVLSAAVYHAFPFSRTDAVEPSLRYLAELIDEGWSILIYPEGRRSRTGEMVPFKGGIGVIARAMQVPVVPMAVSGCFEALPAGRRFPRPARLRVEFGEPIMPPFQDGPESIAAMLEEHVRALVKRQGGASADA
jgi:long-chain acyl-CoA synthetase